MADVVSRQQRGMSSPWSQMLAIAKGAPPLTVKKCGCFSIFVHSLNPSAGTRHRRKRMEPQNRKITAPATRRHVGRRKKRARTGGLGFERCNLRHHGVRRRGKSGEGVIIWRIRLIDEVGKIALGCRGRGATPGTFGGFLFAGRGGHLQGVGHLDLKHPHARRVWGITRKRASLEDSHCEIPARRLPYPNTRTKKPPANGIHCSPAI